MNQRGRRRVQFDKAEARRRERRERERDGGMEWNGMDGWGALMCPSVVVVVGALDGFWAASVRASASVRSRKRESLGRRRNYYTTILYHYSVGGGGGGGHGDGTVRMIRTAGKSGCRAKTHVLVLFLLTYKKGLESACTLIFYCIRLFL